MQRGIKRIMGKIKKRAGFTLIEVVVAIGILMIVVLALLSSYYTYYSRVKDLRYKAIGENIAKLQLEDLKNLPIGALQSLIDGNPFPEYYEHPNYPEDYDSNPTNGYDSGEIDGSFYFETLETVVGTTASPTSPGYLLEEYLPDSIELEKFFVEDPLGTKWYYRLILLKEVFPRYFKRIEIRELTGNTDITKKLYEITVTVYWGPEGNKKSISFKTERGYE